ncbi:MAG TPA: tlde1 domain-containing protein [Candidatus Kapabacteria bacterium]|jgi:hypothetical protein
MLTYEQSTGKLFRDGTPLGTGYAGGFCGQRPDGVNNPALQFVHDVGPLCEGGYTLGEARDSAHLGPYAIPLVPEPSNNMGGRGGFFIHGDVIGKEGQCAASDGCIIMARSIRNELRAGEQLTVVSGI